MELYNLRMPESKGEIDAQRLKDTVDDQVIRLGNIIISQAVNDKAEEIIIDFQPYQVKVFYRVAGALHHVMSPPGFLREGLSVWLKQVAHMVITEFGPQGMGPTRLDFEGRDLHLYFRTRPCQDGELMTIELVWP